MGFIKSVSALSVTTGEFKRIKEPYDNDFDIILDPKYKFTEEVTKTNESVIATNTFVQPASKSTKKLYDRTEKYYKIQKWIGIAIGAFTLVTTITSMITCNKTYKETRQSKVESTLPKDTSSLLQKNKDHVRLSLKKKFLENNKQLNHK